MSVQSSMKTTLIYVLALSSMIGGLLVPFLPIGPVTLTLITQGTFTAIMATSVGLLIHQCGLISCQHCLVF